MDNIKSQKTHEFDEIFEFDENYFLDRAKKQLHGAINQALGYEIPGYIYKDFNSMPIFGGLKDGLSINAFLLSIKKNDQKKEFEKIKKEILNSGFYYKKYFHINNFYNFQFIQEEVNRNLFKDFKKIGNNYGKSDVGKDKTIIIDYSSPNIAKPFSIGHLRSTVIGDALYKIYKSQGYNVISDNHLGDWGTQFGKLICAYKKWGDRSKIEKDSLKELLKLYVKFHKEAKNEPILMDNAREEFKKLEQGDRETKEIWEWMSTQSLDKFTKIYDLLNVRFDKILGESFYRDKTDEIIKIAEKKGIAKWETAINKNGKEPNLPADKAGNQKVLLIDLKEYGIKTPIILKKSDGTALYATRDLATIKYRVDTWNPDKIMYVVGAEQELYFRQLFKTAELLGLINVKKLKHIKFGLFSLPEGKMSTRKGKIIFLEDVINESIKKVKYILHDREMSKYQKEQIAKIVGIGAIKYADLSHDKKHNIKFNWDKVLSLKGNSGPYLQYQYVRIDSILSKGKFNKINKIKSELLSTYEEVLLIRSLYKFNEQIKFSLIDDQPHNLANYLYGLSTQFSKFYEKHPVINAKNQELKNTRLYLCFMVSQVLKNGLKLLGIDVPEKM